MFEKIKKYWNRKSLFGKISDVIFVLLITAFLFPAGRMAIGGGINRIKAMIIQPAIEKNRISLPDTGLSWELITPDGKNVNIDDYKGKVKFINLWATWCPPCIGEMPEIEKLYNKFKDNENIAFFMISDENTEKIKAFINKKGYTFPVFQSVGNNPLGFRSKSIPATYILSKDNQIVVKETGAAKWGGKKSEDIINKLLNE